MWIWGNSSLGKHTIHKKKKVHKSCVWFHLLHGPSNKKRCNFFLEAKDKKDIGWFYFSLPGEKHTPVSNQKGFPRSNENTHLHWQEGFLQVHTTFRFLRNRKWEREREQELLPVSQQICEGHLTHSLIGRQHLGPVPLSLAHSWLLTNEHGVLLVINQR